jgi:hypothetical protein
MNFNFNIGGVRVAYQKSDGTVKQALVTTRSQFNYIELHYTMIEAVQTHKGN